MRSTRSRNLIMFAAATMISAMLALPVHAQFAGMQQPNNFRDTSMLRPPTGAKVAVVEFEDLECPACANAYTIVHQAVAQYKVPLVRYDFPLKMHIWSFDAAVYARWMQDKVNPSVANDYRGAVFGVQQSITSKDDLQRFTRKFAADRKIQLPFMVDPSGDLANKVRADYALGEKLNVTQTPTIVVVTNGHYQQINGDANQIFSVLEGAIAQTKTQAAAPVRTSASARKH